MTIHARPPDGGAAAARTGAVLTAPSSPANVTCMFIARKNVASPWPSS